MNLSNLRALKKLRELLERTHNRARLRAHPYYERKLAEAMRLMEEIRPTPGGERVTPSPVTGAGTRYAEDEET